MRCWIHDYSSCFVPHTYWLHRSIRKWKRPSHEWISRTSDPYGVDACNGLQKSRPKVSIKIPSEYFNRYNLIKFMQTFHFLHMTYLFAIPALSMESTFSSWPRP